MNPDWDHIRTRWQQQPTSDAMAASIDELRRRDQALQRKVHIRDRVESLAAAFVVVVFSILAAIAARGAAWGQLVFALWLAAWALFVPLHLRNTRRRAADPECGLPLLDFLHHQRAAALAQARMLERAWLWYVAPCLSGIIGLTLAIQGPTRPALIYIAATLAFGALITWLNRYAARTRFHAHANALQKQIESVIGEKRP